ncbi:MAG: hypothetical protein DWQ30_10030 [Acidobacteria bacterium]|nr:MAG: hypothetical protein DWQ30_10030 [Acidobacteriota bacterium]
MLSRPHESSGSEARRPRRSGTRSAATFLLLCSGLALLAPPVAAHELYLLAKPRPAGDGLLLELRIGHAFEGEPVPRLPDSFESLDAIDEATGRTPVDGVWQVHPAGFVPGWDGEPRLFVYRSRPIPHRLGAERFNAYLAEEGLDAVLAQRRRDAQLEAPGRELYSRCSRALSPALALDRPLPTVASVDGGCSLELRLLELEGPDAGGGLAGRLALEVRFEDQPVAGLLVRHTSRTFGGAIETTTSRSGADGRVRIAAAPGEHLLNVVHAIALDAEADADADANANADRDDPDFDWRSYWTSLSFELLPPSSAPSPSG